MKLVVVVVAILAVFPIGHALKGKDRVLYWLAVFIGFLPFIGLDSVDVNVVSFEKYRGDSRGIEITLLDLCAGILLVALPPSKEKTPLKLQRFFYLGAVVLSLFSAPNPFFGFFSVWKLLRMFFLFGVVVHAGRRYVPALVTGFGAGVVWEFLLSIDQRYHQGLPRVAGNLLHPNSLGMAVNLVLPIALALVLSQKRARLATMAALTGALCVVLSLSRGALAMLVLAGAIVYLGSAMRRLDGRKIAVAVAAVIAAGLVAFKAGDTIMERFAHAPKASEEARVLFNHAAAAMLRDHPFGVGMNQFSFVLSHKGYAAHEGIPPVDRDGIAHHVYWLTAAETGYVGLIAYALVLATPLILALKGAVTLKDVRGDVLLGCAAGLTVTYLQGTAEWIARQTVMSYLFWMITGIVIVLTRKPA